MKEETKKKLCKISKIVGFAITFGFAVFGALCAAMLIGHGGKKDDIKTLDSSLVLNEVRSERNSKPRKAPDFSGQPNLLEVSERFEHVSVNASRATYSDVESCNLLNLEKGYYYFSNPNGWSSWAVGFNTSIDNVKGIFSYVGTEGPTYTFPEDWGARYLVYNQRSLYFYWEGGPVVFSGSSSAIGYLYLVDTLDLPATSNIYLGENWNPLKAFGDNLSPKGGYLIRNQNWTFATYTLPSLQLSGLLFKYEGEVFDRINITLYPLNASHTPYVDSTGKVITPSDNSGTQEIYALQSVSFSQSWNNVADLGDGIYLKYSVPVLSGSRADTPVGGKYPYNGSVIWASQSRTIEVIDDKGTTSERFDNRFLGMSDLELVKFLSQYQSEAIDVVNTGGMFSLFTNAFDSLMPILSIAILPNITLGMILFIPLVGGIIVVIIRLVKK